MYIEGSNVESMKSMFTWVKSANPDMANWEFNDKCNTEDMFAWTKSDNPDAL